MDILEQLSDEQRDLIFRLPYRAGMWVSLADRTGGDESQAREEQVLHGLLHGFSGQVFGSEFIQHIMAGTLACEGQWPQWKAEIEAFPSECERAIAVLRDVTDAKEVNAFVIRLMEIGEAVATAFRENPNDLPFGQKMRLYVLYLKSVLGKKQAVSFDMFMQVSLDERDALNRMAQVLGTRYP